MTAPAVSITGASKKFGKTTALNDVDFKIDEGEKVALLGPNGAGKTTLIRSIVGRCRLDKGEISLLGSPASKESRRQIGFVPQDLAVHGLLTAEENLRFFGRLQGVKGAKLAEKIKEALKWTSLDSRRHDLVKTFSGGMKRRLNIACGVMHDPGIVLLDEPTVGVDPQSRERIHEMLEQLHGQGSALLLTTHMMEEAERCANRIVIQDHGCTIANGTAMELVTNSFGSMRTLKVTLSSFPDAPFPEPWATTGNQVSRKIGNVDEVTQVLADFSEKGLQVESLQVDAPSLQEVFLKLTGRDLRE